MVTSIDITQFTEYMSNPYFEIYIGLEKPANPYQI
jgi:hypothetical protein